MRAFVQVREYLLAASTVSAELNELRAKVDLLALQREEDLGAVNDLSEDVRGKKTWGLSTICRRTSGRTSTTCTWP